MKTKLLFLAFMMAVFTIGVNAQTRYLNGLPTGKGVDTVTLNKAMLQVAGEATLKRQLGQASNVVKNLDCIEVYNCENKGLLKSAKAKFNSMIAASGAECMVSSQDDEDDTAIYTITKAGETNPTVLFIYSSDKDELSIVVIHGEINFAELMKMKHI